MTSLPNKVLSNVEAGVYEDYDYDDDDYDDDDDNVRVNNSIGNQYHTGGATSITTARWLEMKHKMFLFSAETLFFSYHSINSSPHLSHSFAMHSSHLRILPRLFAWVLPLRFTGTYFFLLSTD